MCVPLIKTDSKYVISGLVLQLNKCSATTKFQWIKGHNGEIGNKKSDELEKKGANKETPDEVSTEIPTKFNKVQGVKLSALTQATSYSGIREMAPKQRKMITKNLEKILHKQTKESETDLAI